jgi:hypothetical protein
MIDPAHVRRFADLFQGNMKEYGTYKKEEREENGVKMSIKGTARTMHEPVTDELFKRHLSGEQPIGISPINKDGQCCWGCLDVDQYGINLPDLATQLEAANYKAIVCRSKSGHAHVFVFVREPIAAESMRSKITEIAAALGYAESEIFPKQTALAGNQIGNWLNLPYLNSDDTNRYCVRSDRKQLTLSQFLDYAEQNRVTRSELDAMGGVQNHLSDKFDELKDGPPCLQALALRGFPEGGRNNALFNLAVLVRKKLPDDWESTSHKWNATLFSQPLQVREVGDIIRSARKKNYQYTCKTAPICNYCNQRVCRTRKYWIGGTSQILMESISIQDYDNPLYTVQMSDGNFVTVDAAELSDPKKFGVAVMRQTHKLYSANKPAHDSELARMLENPEIVPVPDEARPGGRLKELIDDFFMDHSRADSLDEIVFGHPFFDQEQNRFVFRSRDLLAFCQRENYEETGSRILKQLKDWGAYFPKSPLRVRGKGVRVMYMPNIFEDFTEPPAIPRFPGRPI